MKSAVEREREIAIHVCNVGEGCTAIILTANK